MFWLELHVMVIRMHYCSIKCGTILITTSCVDLHMSFLQCILNEHSVHVRKMQQQEMCAHNRLTLILMSMQVTGVNLHEESVLQRDRPFNVI